jgi:hypothetical protein
MEAKVIVFVFELRKRRNGGKEPWSNGEKQNTGSGNPFTDSEKPLKLTKGFSVIIKCLFLQPFEPK